MLLDRGTWVSVLDLGDPPDLDYIDEIQGIRA